MQQLIYCFDIPDVEWDILNDAIVRNTGGESSAVEFFGDKLAELTANLFGDRAYVWLEEQSKEEL